MWVMWPITTEHPRAASEYSRPIATLVEQLVWTVWKGNDVKRAAWLNAAKLPAVELKKKLCFLPRVILLSNFVGNPVLRWPFPAHPNLPGAELQLSFGGSTDRDTHGSCDGGAASQMPPLHPHPQAGTLLPQAERGSSTFCKHGALQM